MESLSENPTVSPFTNEILLVPEPATLMPLIPGLLALAALGLKRATAQQQLLGVLSIAAANHSRRTGRCSVQLEPLRAILDP